jgi:hypothetical protein
MWRMAIPRLAIILRRRLLKFKPTPFRSYIRAPRMTSAYELHRAGQKVRILECQDRPGGRNWSLYGGDAFTELDGGAFSDQTGKEIYKGICQGRHMPDANGVQGAWRLSGPAPDVADTGAVRPPSYPAPPLFIVSIRSVSARN